MPSINPAAFIIGPAFVRYRDVGVLTPYTDVGVTLDDAVMRILSETWSPDNMSGVYGKVRGLDVQNMVGAEIAFTLGEVAGEKLALAIPGSTYTAAVSADAGGTPLSTTTTSATVAGASTIPCTAVTNAAVGDYISIDTGSVKEYRRITAITSLVLTLDWPLLFAHASGVAVVETTGDNRSVVTMPTYRRAPATAYKEWSIVAESGKSGPNELVLPIGIASAASAEMTVSDSAVAGIRVTISGRLDETDLTKSIYKLHSPA